jgi:hypothetical protein
LNLKKHEIGKACWSCKYRKTDNWFVHRDFCEYYPSLEEREILRGLECGYYKKRGDA